MTEDSPTATDSDTHPPVWLALAPGETIQWRGTRRSMAVVPTAVGAVPFVLAGLFAILALPPTDLGVVVPLAGLLVVAGALALVGWQFLALRNTEYVLTDERLYAKRGVLSLSVAAVDYETVQNVTYSRTITGTLFDHGTLSFDTAGGSATELTFADIDDPRPVERLVNERLSRVGGQTSEGIPGTTAQWETVLDEVRAIRRSLDGR